MASPALRRLLHRLATASEPLALSPEERALLADHLASLSSKPRQTTKPKAHAAAKAAGVSPTGDPIPSPRVAGFVKDHERLSQARDAALASGLQALITALDDVRLSKSEALSLAQALLPGGKRYRSGAEALAAVKARLIQRYRDAVRTATLAGEQ